MSKSYNLIVPSTNEYEAFGTNLKALLRENEITNKELGFALNLSDQTISDYLNWFSTNKGKQPFWVPMLKLIKFLEENTDNFNIYDLITKRYTQTYNITEIRLENKPRLKNYKNKLDKLTIEYNNQLIKYETDLSNYHKTLKENEELKNKLSEASRNIYLLNKSINIKDVRIEKLEKMKKSLLNKINNISSSKK